VGDQAPTRRRGTSYRRSARTHLTPVAEGGKLIPGAPAAAFTNTPLGDLPLKLFEACECDYVPPPGLQKDDPAWSEWTEDPPRTDNGKQSLRMALTRSPGRRHPGGLLGPNFYALCYIHSGDPRRDTGPGFPDLLIWTPVPGVDNEVWELKVMGEKPSLPQAHHMTTLEASGFKVRTVRPCCLLSGSVDRWLGRLSGKAPDLSEWAPGGDRQTALQRAARAAIAGPPAAAPAPSSPPRRRQLAVVPDPPGRPVDDQAAGDAEASAYLVPMPGGRADDARRQLEEWLREHGFPASSVPWPMRVVVAGPLVVAWVNTGEPGRPGQPRPRCWRSSYLERSFPAHLVAELGGEARTAASVRAAMALIDPGAPAGNLPEETR
jgi:hypothetical protein